MSTVSMNKYDDIIMRLVHYFITEQNYQPIVVNGVKNEIWLENEEGPYKIIRINSNYIHNDEQFNYDIFKTKNIMKQIKKKTLSIKMNTLNIFLNINDRVKVDNQKNIEVVVVNNIKDIEKSSTIKEVFPDIKNKLLDDVKGIDLLVNVTKDINEKTEEKNKAYEKVFKPKKIIITNIIIFICILVYITMLNEQLGNIIINYGANYGPLVRENIINIYRTISCIFIHASVVHLICNMYALYVIGTQVETFLGKKKFIAIYLISGFLGSLMSIVFSNNASIGASGAIFGLMGSLLYFGFHYRLYIGAAIKQQIVPILILNLILGFTIPGIDMAAHIGGLIGGYLCTMAVGVNKDTTKSERINGTLVLIILIAFLSYVGIVLK